MSGLTADGKHDKTEAPSAAGLSITAFAYASMGVFVMAAMLGVVLAVVVLGRNFSKDLLTPIGFLAFAFILGFAVVVTWAFLHLCGMDVERRKDEMRTDPIANDEFAVHFFGRTWRWKRKQNG